MKDDFKEAIFVATGVTAPTRFLNCMTLEKKDNLSALLHLSFKDAEKIPNFGAACLEVLRQIQAKLRETGQSLYFSKENEGKLPEDFNDCTHPHVPVLRSCCSSPMASVVCRMTWSCAAPQTLPA